MAIEWTIESGSAVSPGQLAHATTKLLGAVLGTAPDGVRIDGDAEDFTLRVSFDEAEGAAEVTFDAHGDGDVWTTVTAYRTQLSAAVALVAAVALADLSGGELSGPGLVRRYRGDLADLIADLTPAGPDPVSNLSDRFGWTFLPPA
ncbi:hypothetical protein [Phytohabitans aurantiacus]|uniref:Alkyl sulfatase C-terminal domain-containing protein n=1 Tax=Phytohabitans aurantiacus TaxID=3016789 RepID=A0ABQ5R3D9_9ACTN|nr:hypothetical protein [Phytohabitans aurantiacus]GLI01307.1 hypothetical protein Pa4123_65830 [Phytohabitans aurantiacus]